MVTYHILVGVLLYSTAINGYPTAEESTTLHKKERNTNISEDKSVLNPLDFNLSSETNKIKRQSNNKSSTEKSEDDSKKLNVAALEESFGGNSGAAAETVDENLPPPRRNGFYYLVDWNSFLEVGEDNENKVSIRFSPQAGDSSRFLRVNVP